MKHTIDAQNKKLGRIASEAAKMLLGKHQAAFVRNAVSEDTVEIINAAQADISDKKKIEHNYSSFSGFAGGLRYQSMQRTIEKQGIKEVFTRAIYGMLPKNKLRDRIIKHVTITE